MRIMIDAGHGGEDPGAVGNGLQEKDLTLKLALRIGRLLAARGADVHYTRTDDTFVDVSDRARAANKAEVDYFLSIHINAGGETGFESFTYPGSSGPTSAYRNVIHRKVAGVFEYNGLPDRGQKQADLTVLQEMFMPAVLFEYGFIENVRDAKLLNSKNFIEQIVSATAAGVAEAFGLPAPQPIDDVSEWAREARDWAVWAGITDGTKPRDAVTREEVWTMLYRMKN